MSIQKRLQQVTIGPLNQINGTIQLCPYSPDWAMLYQQQEKTIKKALGDRVMGIEHVGSTSVPGLCAKPIIDIVLLVKCSAAEEEYVPLLEQVGYKLRIREEDWHQHRMLRKEQPSVNLHVFSVGCQEAKRMIAFRDHLRQCRRDRDLYAAKKMELAAKKCEYVQQYADAKTQVVQQILNRIREAWE